MTQANDAGLQPTDAAQPIRVAVGGDFTIVLEANHTTGYSWELAPGSHSGITHVGTDYQAASHAPGMVGVGGWEVWTFHAQARRPQTHLTFHYLRPFDRAAPPAEVVTFTVISG